jgi:hypothetical protein
MLTSRLAQRDEELVNLLRRDKAAFLQEYRRVFAIPDSEPLSGLLDRDMIRAILDREFPERQLSASSEPK